LEHLNEGIRVNRGEVGEEHGRQCLPVRKTEYSLPHSSQRVQGMTARALGKDEKHPQQFGDPFV
jgi:hypothetical protein